MCVAGNNRQNKVFSPSMQRKDSIRAAANMTTTKRLTRRRSSANSKADNSICSKQERSFVQHNYVDHYFDPLYHPGENEVDRESPKRRGPRGGVVTPFPERLYTMLGEADQGDFEHIVSWQPHGRCFIVHKPKLFVEEVMPK